jgi:hypothetical protein
MREVGNFLVALTLEGVYRVIEVGRPENLEVGSLRRLSVHPFFGNI